MQQRLAQQDRQLAEHARELVQQQTLLERKDRELALRQAKIEKINFELARLKRWKFRAKSEALTTDQRQLFQDTVAEDEASLQAQLAALQASLPETPKVPKAPPRKPRRQALPQHLRRVEHRHEPEDTTCGCGQPMARVAANGRTSCRRNSSCTGTSTASGRAAAARA